MDETSISMMCSEYVHNLDYAELPEEVVIRAKYCLVDFMGCVISGSTSAEGKIIIDHAEKYCQPAQANIIGRWTKSTMLNAAMANAYNCHVHEMDDVHRASVLHPGAPVIGAALAVAEANKRSGKNLIEAIVGGYDVMMRIGEAVMPSHYEIWHTTGTCGTFGATASAGKLFGLTKAELTHALGNAGSQAAGLWQFLEDNAMTKYLHCGKAAYNGLLAAMLAQSGLTGAKRIVEGERGFVVATSAEVNPEEKFRNIGSNYKIMETSYKPFASCRHTHSTINAVLNLKKEHNIKIQQVDKIVINIYRTATLIAQNNEVYETARAAKFSLVYCAAAALKFGTVSVDAFSNEALKNPEILRVAKKTSINIDENIDKAYPEKWMSRVVIEVAGKQYEKLVEYPKGDPENPFSESDYYDKYMNLAKTAMSEEKADELFSKCMKLEKVEDLSTFFN